MEHEHDIDECRRAHALELAMARAEGLVIEIEDIIGAARLIDAYLRGEGPSVGESVN